MTSYKLFLVLFVMLAIQFVFAESISCYNCINCKTVDDETQSLNCEGGRRCFIAGHADIENWSRGCGPSDFCEQYTDVFKDHMCSTCNDDMCNGP